MSRHAHDLVFAAGSLLLAAALLPALLRRTLMPRSTCLTTASVLLVLVLNLAALGFWYAAATDFLALEAWAYLLAVAHTHHHGRANRAPTLPMAAGAVTVALLVAIVVSHAGALVGPRVHDVIFAVAYAALLIALLPAVVARPLLPLATCAPISVVTLAFTVNLASMRYWYSSATEFASFACWSYLLSVALTRTRTRPPHAPAVLERRAAE